MGGRVFEFGNPEGGGGGGGSRSFGNPGGRGGKKTMPSVVGVWIFSAITHWIEGWKKKLYRRCKLSNNTPLIPYRYSTNSSPIHC